MDICYYIDIDKRNPFTGFSENISRVEYPITDAGAIQAYMHFASIARDNINPVDHATLRVYRGGIHGLIAEYSPDMRGIEKYPCGIFWFTNYPEYKEFSSRLNIEPGRVQLECEKAEFLRRFPTFKPYI